MIEAQKLCKRYSGGYDALNDVSFSIEKGEKIFLTGHSGAGKSTLLKLIAKLVNPTSGQLIVNGTPLHSLSKKEIMSYRQDLGLIFQSPCLLPDRTVFENVALPLFIQGVSHNMVKKRVHAALDMVGLLTREKWFPPHLSAGEAQRVGIARAVVSKPKLVLADEPTGNLDMSLAKDIMGIFEQFNQVGVSIIVATHDLALIAGMKYRMLVLKRGVLC